MSNTWRTVGVLWAGGAAVVAAVAILPAVAWAGTTWDGGGGIDTNLTTAANWNDDSAPTFTGGTSTLTFAAAGSTATVNTAADLARIILDRDASFTIANGSGALTLQGENVGGGGGCSQASRPARPPQARQWPTQSPSRSPSG